MTTTSALWIGPDDTLALGDVGFLILQDYQDRGTSRYILRFTPAHTNQSFEPRIDGWCGTTNNIATFAAGMARVERIAKNHRCLVRRLTGDDLAAALDDLGYPELA